MNREQKKREKARRQREYHARRRQACERVLTALGADAWFHGLCPADREMLTRLHLRKPRVEIDSSAANDPFAPLVVQELEKMLATPLAGISPVDFYSVGVCLPAALNMLPSLRDGRIHEQELAEVERIRSRFWTANHDMLRGMAANIVGILIHFTSFENGPYWCDLQVDKPPHAALNMTLGHEAPETVHVPIDGEIHRAYRCGAPTIEANAIRSITWPAAMLGLNDGPDELPVYIQSHAIRRVHERINLPFDDKNTVNGNLFLSVAEPNVVQQVNDDFWIEFKLGPFRLGYLIARRLPDKVVIRTFLFLTMQGTPEAKLLFDKLRLRRSDIEYTQLDRFETFFETDIRKDPVLCDLLAECHCGQLTSLIFYDGRKVHDTIKAGHAANLRKYLESNVPRLRS